MPYFAQGGTKIYFEEVGDGHPVLLIAPGGMKSALSFWQATPWNPIAELADSYRVIAMDQRNAGASSAPVSGNDTWSTYAQDQLGLMDHLGVDRFHVMGMCIGGPYAMGLIAEAPQRVACAVLFQSIGLMAGGANRDAFYAMFDDWATQLKPGMDVPDAEWAKFRSSMYDGDDFLFNVGDDFVRSCATPLCVLEGNDLYHPQETSLRLRALAPNVEYIERWKDGADLVPAKQQVIEFLARHSA